jgi:GMP synthase-like glutamine amidotransferase
VGILTIPTSDVNLTRLGDDYIIGSYVNWIESAGAVVVPVRYRSYEDAAGAKLRSLLDCLDGVVLQGGSSQITNGTSNFVKATEFILRYAIERANTSSPLNVWGTCQGFQQLVLFAAGEEGRNLSNNYGQVDQTTVLIDGLDAENILLPLQWARHEPSTAAPRMLQAANAAWLKEMADNNLTINFHTHGVALRTFYTTRNSTSIAANEEPSTVGKFFRPLAVSYDREGRQFVAMIEGRELPFYGVQFHPEKNAYEWVQNSDLDGGGCLGAAAHLAIGDGHEEGQKGGSSVSSTGTTGCVGGTIASSREGVAGSTYFARFFVSECRKSAAAATQARGGMSPRAAAGAACSAQAMAPQLIYGYQPVGMNKTNGLHWQQTYFFP